MTASTPTLTDKILILHRALQRKRIPHAYGGAIALAYYTAEPRATRDIDVNVFVRAADMKRLFATLPKGVTHDDMDLVVARRDGQRRVHWGITPLDLFFSNVPFHDYAQRNTRTVKFANTHIPILAGTDLVIFKAFFNRDKDWIDIDAVAAVNGADFDVAVAWTTTLLGADDARVERLTEIAANKHAAQQAPGDLILADAMARRTTATNSDRGTPGTAARCPMPRRDGTQCRNQLNPGRTCPAHHWTASLQATPKGRVAR